MRLCLSILLMAAFEVGAADEVCAALKGLLDARQLERHRLEQSGDRFFNVDLDGDEFNDDVRVTCPGSTCLLVAKLSSGKTIEFAAPRFYLARFRAKVYAVSGRTIFEFRAAGTRVACGKL